MEPISTLATLPTSCRRILGENLLEGDQSAAAGQRTQQSQRQNLLRDAQYLGGRLQGTAEQLDSARGGERAHRQGQQQQRREHLPHHPQTLLHPFGKSRQQIDVAKHRNQEYQTEQGRNDQYWKRSSCRFPPFLPLRQGAERCYSLGSSNAGQNR